MVGIYKLSFNRDKFYVGSSVNIKDRVYHHKGNLRKNIHCNPHLQNAWNKYGEENFSFEVLEECDKINLIEREQYYLDSLKPQYNICKKAYSPPPLFLTDEIIKKRSEGIKKAWTQERREEHSLLRKGKKLTWIDYNKSKTWSKEGKYNNLLQKRKSKKVCKLDEYKVREIKEYLKTDMMIKDIASIYNVSRTTISDIKYKRTWVNL